ncbi:MAG: helix-turn-helix domain-containing protein [Parasutterella excrementihominis]
MREIHNLMTIGEVAGSFGVCVATVRRWCKNGKFSRVIRTIGNQRHFDPYEVHDAHPTGGKGSWSDIQELQVMISARI